MNETIEISKDLTLKELVKAISENEQLMDKIRKLDAGNGTYSEVDDIAAFIGEEIARQLTPYYSAELLEAWTIAGHDLIVLLSKAAQQNLNNAAKIGVKPMTTKYPKAKVAKVAAEFAAVSEEVLPQKIKNELPSLALTMVDDIVDLLGFELMKYGHCYGTVSENGEKSNSPLRTVPTTKRDLITRTNTTVLIHDMKLLYLTRHIEATQRHALVINKGIIIPTTDDVVLDI